MSTTNTWNGATADWNTPGDWSNDTTPNSSNADALLTQGTIAVDSGDSYALNALILANPGALLEVDGTLNFSGGADHQIDIQGGELALGPAGTLQGAPDVVIGAHGVLDFSADTQATQTIGGLSDAGTLILGNVALSIGAGGADSTLSGLIETGTVAPEGGIINKIGAGTVTLDNVTMNPGTDSSALYIDTGSLLESTGSSSVFYIAVGEGTGASASATLSGGTLAIGSSAKAALQIGDFGGTGTFTQTGGLLTVTAGSVNIGNQGGNGEYEISAGTLAFDGGVFDIGRTQNNHPASSGTLAISGGLVDIAAGQLVLGSQYTPSTSGSSGTIVQTGGELRIESGENFYLSGQPGSQGSYALDGGTLEVGGAGLNGGGGIAGFTLGGGTIAVLGTALVTGVNAILATGTTSELVLNGLGASFSGTVSGDGHLDIRGTGIVSFAALDTTGITVQSGATLATSGVENGVVISSGGTEIVASGDTSVSATVINGGTQVVTNGGTVIGAIIEQNSTQIISLGGVAIDTTVGDPSVQTIASGGTAFTTTLSAGGEMDVYGSVTSTTVETGGNEVLYTGGTASGNLIENGGTLILDGGTATHTTIGAGGTLIAEKLSYAGDMSAGISAGTLMVSEGGSVVFSLQLDDATDAASIYVTSTSDGGTELVLCFYPGTNIATPQGQIAVEVLRPGDLVLTGNGVKPVRWIGQSHVSMRFADRLRSLPVRITQGALGHGLPVRDLLLSPDHAVFIGGVLAQANALVNGVTIFRETNVPEQFSYYHIELDSHELLLAEGVQAETFVDNVDRMHFHNWDGRTAPAMPIEEMEYPRAKSQRQLPQAVCRMLAVSKRA